MEPNTDAHTALIAATLRDRFGLSPEHLGIQRVEHAKNNHVYLVDMAPPTSELREDASSRPQPFTSVIPAGTSRLVFRIANADASLEDAVRVRNEVACLALGRQALASVDARLVPRVYAWNDRLDAEGGGLRWILEEWKGGETWSADRVEALDEETQRLVLDQLAAVVKAFQDFRLPDGSRGFGGLTFDDDGVLANTASTIPCGGPFATYADFLKGMCLWQRAASERSPHLNGWRDVPALRTRLDALFAGGLDELLARVPAQQPTLVHADLCFPNLLFDPATHRLAAVLDFDFSHVGAPVSEFLFSFWDVNGILPGSAEPQGPVRKWLLKGFPKRIDARFRLARSWDEALGRAGAKKPSSIEEAGHVADIWWFSQELCQAYWFMDRFVAHKSEEALAKLKAGSARRLEKFLALWGF
ncbi:hypothetical protein VTK73DRAFT_2868 [Phialemonium thermophilum]|uniref:Aminoglycoside phosphotransferase domain-containing protein n=1 Tax=Phialemonium thermophilum TaxID=223376 RepID=A0ABR3VNY9_9PEZI